MQLRSSFLGKERIEYKKLQMIRREKLDDLRADHAGAENPDFRAVIARKMIIRIVVVPVRARTDTTAEKALAGEDDFGDGDFRDRNSVGAPSRMDGDAEFEERTREALHASRGIKDVFQIWEITLNLLF